MLGVHSLASDNQLLKHFEVLCLSFLFWEYTKVYNNDST